MLVTRCRRRNVAAWDELVERWNDRLLYYLRRMIGNEHDASNAVQEVWLNAVSQLQQPPGRITISAVAVHDCQADCYESLPQ